MYKKQTFFIRNSNIEKCRKELEADGTNLFEHGQHVTELCLYKLRIRRSLGKNENKNKNRKDKKTKSRKKEKRNKKNPKINKNKKGEKKEKKTRKKQVKDQKKMSEFHSHYRPPSDDLM